LCYFPFTFDLKKYVRQENKNREPGENIAQRRCFELFFMALQPLVGLLPFFSVSEAYAQSVGLLGRGSARRKAATYTQDNTDVYASSGIRTHHFNPSVLASEDSSGFIPYGHCGQRFELLRPLK
jgi:hypothetical protein